MVPAGTANGLCQSAILAGWHPARWSARLSTSHLCAQANFGGMYVSRLAGFEAEALAQAAERPRSKGYNEQSRELHERLQNVFADEEGRMASYPLNLSIDEV